MKLNLLILSLIGVSVSASGIRGFVPIKGSDRRLATPKSSSSKSKSGGSEVLARCVGHGCRKYCEDLTQANLRDFDYLFITTNKSSKSTSGDRRLASTSKSKSSSTSTDNADFLYISREGVDCTYRLVASSPKSSSKSSSKRRRRLTKTTTTTSSSNKSTSGGGQVLVRCIGEGCEDECPSLTPKQFKALGLTSNKSSKSTSGDRRLASTSKSKSSSTSTDNADFVFISREGVDCTYRLYTGPSKGTPKSSSKSKGR